MAFDLFQRGVFFNCLLSIFLISFLGEISLVRAQENDIWKVEEDWELRTYQPDPSIYSPQVTFFVTPDSTKSDTYFQLQMNYARVREYSEIVQHKMLLILNHIQNQNLPHCHFE